MKDGVFFFFSADPRLSLSLLFFLHGTRAYSLFFSFFDFIDLI